MIITRKAVLADISAVKESVEASLEATVSYLYDPLNDVTKVEENGATSGPGLLATYAYDGLGRRTAIARAGGSGLATAYQYGSNGLLSQLTQSLAGSAATTFNFTYNTAGQILTRQDTNGGYTARPAALSSTYATNGLNQYTSATGVEQTYSGADSAALSYDALGRLQTETATGSATTFLYDGSQLVGEYGVNGSILNRYVMGPGVDEPLTWYSGAGTSSRAWYAADNAGSVIATADQSGNSTATYDYGPYGEPITSAGVPAWGGSRYRYTGQIEVPGAEVYYYKARVYDPGMGRFYQTDPAGLTSDVNLYAYVGQDPINIIDSTGMGDDDDPWIVCDADGNCTNVDNLPPCGPGTGADNSCEITVNPTRNVPYAGNLTLVSFSSSPAGGASGGVGSPQSNQQPIHNGCSSLPGFSQFNQAAQTAASEFPQNNYTPAWLRGIFVHVAFSGIVSGIPNASINIPYRNGVVAGWLDIGSVRPDAVYGNINSPNFIVELKTGNARLQNPQLSNYLNNLPPGTPICEIHEAP